MPLPKPEIESVQPDIVAKLESDGYFVDIPVFAIRQERIRSEIDAALAGRKPKNGKIGIAVEVFMPRLAAANPNAPGPLTTLEMLIRVKENPTLNLGSKGTGKTAESVAVAVLQLLHGFSMPGICGTLYPSAKEAMAPNADFAPLVACDVKIDALFPLTPPPKLTSPSIICPDYTVTLRHPDELAELYYTTDASFPGPNAPSARLYDGPFGVASGHYVRAAAYKTGCSGSDVAMSIIT